MVGISDGGEISRRAQMQVVVRTPIVTAAMTMVVVLILSCISMPWGLTTSAAADDLGPERVFVLESPVKYYGEVRTLTPFWMDTANEHLIMRLCMSTLLTYDQDMNVIGDLAESWTVSSDGLTWTFELADNAYFIERNDPESTNRIVTADDVVYTYQLVQDNFSFLHYYLPGAIDGVSQTLSAISKTSTFSVSMTLTQPYLPFITALTSIPILPKYYWEGLEGNPVEDRWAMPIGSGPFYYDLDYLLDYPHYGLPLKRNPIWFQEANRGWQIHVDRLMFHPWPCLLGDDGTRWQQFVQGDGADCLGTTPHIYTNLGIPAPDYVEIFVQDTGHMYELVLNQMTQEMRDDLVEAGLVEYGSGINNPLLRDPIVKEAIGMCIQKPSIVDLNGLEGFGETADSPIPSCSDWHYTYGSGLGEDPLSFDPDGAREMLWNHGFKFDEYGASVPIDSEVTPLYGYVDGQLVPLAFNLYANWDPGLVSYYAALRLQVNASQAGIEILLNEVNDYSLGDMLSTAPKMTKFVTLNVPYPLSSWLSYYWSAADFDMILANSRCSPVREDPFIDVLGKFTTSAAGSWMTSFQSIPAYDDLYEQALRSTSPEEQRAIADELQRLLYEDMSYQCLAYAKDIYGVSERTWTGYGDWEANTMLMPHLGFPYMYMQISPDGVDESEPNTAPVITAIQSTAEGVVGNPVALTATVLDEASPLSCQWYWGDGTQSGWLSSPCAEHTYTEGGVYTAYFAAKEMSGDDSYISWDKAIVTVMDMSNTAPHDPTIDFTPSDPAYTHEIVTFTGSAVDDDGDELYFSWNFGDSWTATGPVVTHQFLCADSYTVTMYVTDYGQGLEVRPVSTTALVAVDLNSPPIIVVPNHFDPVEEDVPHTFAVYADDPDLRDTLRYTWVWGDGDISVTAIPTAVHTYSDPAVFTLTVYVDDLTGLPDHNVSDLGLVNVIGAPNDRPIVTSFTVSNENPCTDEVITISATAQDPDGDALKFTFIFDDGTNAVFQGDPTAPNTPVTFDVDVSFDTVGLQLIYLHVDDGRGHIAQPDPVAVWVVATPPSLVVTSPNGGEILLKGREYAITWVSADDPSDYVRIDLYKGPSLVDTIASSTLNDGIHLWKIPVKMKPGTNYRVEVIATPSGVSDRSDSYFTIRTAGGGGLISFTLNLVQGSNFVTVPLVNHGYYASTLGLMYGDVIYGWDSATQAYNKVYYVGIFPPEADFPIEPSCGYLIQTGTAQSLVLYGEEAIETQSIDILVPEGGGFALIGLASLDTTLRASDLVEMYSGTILRVSAWDSELGDYIQYFPGISGPDFLLVPGEALFIECADSGVLSYDP